MKIISEKTNVHIYKIIKLQINDFIVTETYLNNELKSQNWSHEKGFKTTHPDAYEPDKMIFQYYENTDFLNNENNCDYYDFYEEIPESSLILDWNNFNFDNVLCIYLPMDGCIYRINQKEPIPMWRHQSYIGGFCNNCYNLNEVIDALKDKDWIKNIEIIDVPYYNRFDGCTKAVEFDYKLPSEKHLKKLLSIKEKTC